LPGASNRQRRLKFSHLSGEFQVELCRLRVNLGGDRLCFICLDVQARNIIENRLRRSGGERAPEKTTDGSADFHNIYFARYFTDAGGGKGGRPQGAGNSWMDASRNWSRRRK
jgi:hypothetical protein